MVRTHLLLAVLAVTVLGPAMAAPVVDGNVTPADAYTLPLNDTLNEPGLASPNMDISSLQYAGDSDWHYFGLTVQANPISVVGGDDTGSTLFFSIFRDTPTGAAKYQIRIMMGELQSVNLYERVGSSWKPVSLASSDFDMAIDNALEFKVKKSAMPNLNASQFYVTAQLDDQYINNDDVVSGVVPEPVTMTFIAIGGIGLAIRRRR